ncbi:hypothetical protein OAE68_00150 [Synechococcus sp. AH-551-A10]|nr:hypothetical protein [Synechococcus sp. AH-551-A10]MDB4682071.1 hypothetical protein [Synechococcus sp. AH-551-A10]
MTDLRTHSDTEILAEGVEELEDIYNNIEGMFVFAAYKEKEEVLILTRDRFGQKPIYYSSNKNFTAFSTELTALRYAWEGKWEIDECTAATYMKYRHIQAPKTGIKKASKVETGQTIRIDKSGNLFKDRYYFTEFKSTLPCNLTSKGTDRLIKNHPTKIIKELIKKA